MRTVGRRRSILIVSAFVLASCSSGAPTATPAGPASPDGQTAAPTATTTATPSPSAAPSTSPTGSARSGGSAAPPKPTSTTYVLIKETVHPNKIAITEQFRATWVEPAGAATSFHVYGVTSCLRESQANDGMPCVVPGMQIPASKLKLLATAAGDARTVIVTWTRYDEIGPDPYWAILLSASNRYGESKSAILQSGLVCFGCVY
jgi:hypothetical protein